MMWKAMFALLAAIAAFAEDPKGIFVASGSDNKPAVKYSMKLNRGGEMQPVLPSQHFKSGDKFQFVFETNQPLYVYFLLRSIDGNPDSMDQVAGSKGITVVREEKKPSNYQLIWPVNGKSTRLAAHQAQTVPGKGKFFQFDDQQGLEKVVMLFSPQPLDMNVLFPRTSGSSGRSAPTGEALAKTKTQIEAMDANTTSSDTADRGICVGECETYSTPKNPTDPFLVVVDLKHYR
jgi:hypothetical protein